MVVPVVESGEFREALLRLGSHKLVRIAVLLLEKRGNVPQTLQVRKRHIDVAQTSKFVWNV